jgi:hypothetical protein
MASTAPEPVRTTAISHGVSCLTFAPAPGFIFLPLIASAQTPEFEITKVTRNLIPTPQFACARRGTMTSFLHRKEDETARLRDSGGTDDLCFKLTE